MSEAVIVAVMALVGTLGGSWLGVRQANKMVNYRIDQLEKKVDKHNNLCERMIQVEGDIRAIKERMET